jgi:hypothetical protein
MLPGVVRWSLVLLLKLIETHWDHLSPKGSPAGLLDRQDIIEACKRLAPEFVLERVVAGGPGLEPLHSDMPFNGRF